MTYTCKYDAEIAVMKEKIDDMHKALMGNGRPGLIEKWNMLEGSISTWKFLATTGGLTGIISIILTFIN